jgi:hypothetical protein
MPNEENRNEEGGKQVSQCSYRVCFGHHDLVCIGLFVEGDHHMKTAPGRQSPCETYLFKLGLTQATGRLEVMHLHLSSSGGAKLRSEEEEKKRKSAERKF